MICALPCVLPLVLVIGVAFIPLSAEGTNPPEANPRLFMEAGSAGNDYLAIGFSDEVRLLTPFTRDRESILSSLEVLSGRRTALYDALAFAIIQLKNHSNERKAILVVSDFEDNASRTSLQRVKEALREEGILLFGLVSPRGLRNGRAIAEYIVREVGGLSLYPRTDEFLPGPAISTFAEALRYCYIVDYYRASRTGTPRPAIKVKVRRDVAGEKCRVIAPRSPRPSPASQDSILR